MHYFLFVPVESGKTEMALIDAIDDISAIEEAVSAPFAGRTAYLFDGDRFVQEVATAETESRPASTSGIDASGLAPPVPATLRPG